MAERRAGRVGQMGLGVGGRAVRGAWTGGRRGGPDDGQAIWWHVIAYTGWADGRADGRAGVVTGGW